VDLFLFPQAEASNKEAASITAAARDHSRLRDLRTSSSSVTTVDVCKRMQGTRQVASSLRGVAEAAHHAAGWSSRNAQNRQRTTKNKSALLRFTSLELYRPLLKNNHTNFFLDF
jgi:hypothetical protein